MNEKERKTRPLSIAIGALYTVILVSIIVLAYYILAGKQIEAQGDPKVGDSYIAPISDNPFDDTPKILRTVVAVSNGWVQYRFEYPSEPHIPPLTNSIRVFHWNNCLPKK